MSTHSDPAKLPYSPGLEGVIAGESAISAVDPTAGLIYRGYDIHELAAASAFEDIVWLLLHGELPTPAEFEQVREQLAAAEPLPEPVLDMLRLLPADMHPIDVLRTGVSMLAPFDPDLSDHSHDANLRKSIRLIARLATLTTTAWRIARGNPPVPAGANITFAGRFLLGLTGREPEPWRTSAMNVVLALYAEHEFNASTFAARVTASTMSDIYAAVTSAIGTLKGPLHGGANEEAMHMLRDIASPDRAEAWVKQRLAKREKIMGFGHRVYRSGDSRVPMMRQLARNLAKQFDEEALVDICERLEAVMKREKNLYSNLDLYAAPVLYLLGVPPQLNVSVFACSRVAGWCAHVIEQHDHNRLIRPRCIYTGPPKRPLPARVAVGSAASG